MSSPRAPMGIWLPETEKEKLLRDKEFVFISQHLQCGMSALKLSVGIYKDLADLILVISCLNVIAKVGGDCRSGSKGCKQ